MTNLAEEILSGGEISSPRRRAPARKKSPAAAAAEEKSDAVVVDATNIRSAIAAAGGLLTKAGVSRVTGMSAQTVTRQFDEFGGVREFPTRFYNYQRYNGEKRTDWAGNELPHGYVEASETIEPVGTDDKGRPLWLASQFPLKGQLPGQTRAGI